MAGLLASTALVSHATRLLLYAPPGGPLQYNGFPPAAGSDSDSLVSVSFEVPEAIRIESIRVWVNGGGFASVSVKPFSQEWDQPVFASFPIESVTNAPAKWQGVSSLNWDLQPDSYEIFLQAPTIPFGYGFQGAPRFPEFDIDTFRDYSQFHLQDPFGIQVYGSYLSAVPEPATYGLMGGLVLFAVAAGRNRVRRRKSLKQV